MVINNFAVLVSFLTVLLLGPVVIPLLKRMKFGQTIRDEGPRAHQVKSGTPTMGGILFILAIVVGAMGGGLHRSPYVVVVVSLLLFGILGFADDYIKVVQKRNLGLRAYQKLLGQTGIALVIAGMTYPAGRELLIPLTGGIMDLGLWYYPFSVLFMVSVVNAVNLTDGLDGLSTGLSILCMVFYVVVGSLRGDVPMTTGSLIFIMSLLGFLYFNRYPARVFMGDTGSLALGGFIGGMALVSGTPLYILVIGGVFVAETLSVILQVASFKTTGKRIFKMSPLHHHFELVGWSEKKVVGTFWLAGGLLSLLGIALYLGGTP
ncbi:MAG: hypothetical protein AVO33_02660 [delta proteobacterium ML8_F1]|nr:MAG: hypothetical protein AVO33_02660 [delta proteobacterium ML8_F1]